MVYSFVVVVGYFLPFFVGWFRKHRNANALFFADLLLGWTGLGWVGCLIYSFAAVQLGETEAHKKCPRCAEEIKKRPLCAAFVRVRFRFEHRWRVPGARSPSCFRPGDPGIRQAC